MPHHPYMLEEGTPSIQRLVIARSLLKQSVPLDIGTLGAPYQPAGTDRPRRPSAPRPHLRPRGGVAVPQPETAFRLTGRC